MNNSIADIPVYRAIFESSLEAILIVDQDGFILKANPACYKMFGFSTGELIGKELKELIPQKIREIPEEEKISNTRNQELLQRGKQMNLFGTKRNGAQFPIEMQLSLAAIEDKQVKIIFIKDISAREKQVRPYCETVAKLPHLRSMTIERNIVRQELENKYGIPGEQTNDLEKEVAERTKACQAILQKLIDANLALEDQMLETKEAEKKSLASQAMFTAISKNFPKGVIIVINANFDIVYIDGGELYRLGFKKSQFDGLNIDDINVFSKKRIARFKEDVKRTLEGEHLSFETRFMNKNYAVNSSPLLNGNDLIKWTLFVYNDITKQKQAEADIRMALVQAQELNKLKSRFISMASHEFRTPLSAILSSAILIEKQNVDGLEIKREKYIRQIKSNVRKLVVILNDFMSLGKLEEGKVPVKLQLFNLVSFSKNLLEEIGPTKKRGQTLSLKSNKELIEVYLDPKLLQHILINLLSNAIKYSDVDQDILMTLKSGKQSICIEVRDKGIGIPIQEQANLFERFFRAENSLNMQGTGLGLHIVKHYTERLGGAVGFESEEGKGSVFRIEFPVR
ncbi:ATP-binding protein [Muriicola sp.]|uniref:sensor histidine kinase n=1 Tax=Muriicola sp. TaxID=2020856 RepID=UPI003C776ADA